MFTVWIKYVMGLNNRIDIEENTHFRSTCARHTAVPVLVHLQQTNCIMSRTNHFISYFKHCVLFVCRFCLLLEVLFGQSRRWPNPHTHTHTQSHISIQIKAFKLENNKYYQEKAFTYFADVGQKIVFRHQLLLSAFISHLVIGNDFHGIN